jgi:hypothetical protein
VIPFTANGRRVENFEREKSKSFMDVVVQASKQIGCVLGENRKWETFFVVCSTGHDCVFHENVPVSLKYCSNTFNVSA